MNNGDIPKTRRDMTFRNFFVAFCNTCCAIPHPEFLLISPGLNKSLEIKEVSTFLWIGTSFAIAHYRLTFSNGTPIAQVGVIEDDEGILQVIPQSKTIKK
jgi:hypothetical protein